MIHGKTASSVKSPFVFRLDPFFEHVQAPHHCDCGMNHVAVAVLGLDFRHS